MFSYLIDILFVFSVFGGILLLLALLLAFIEWCG